MGDCLREGMIVRQPDEKTQPAPPVPRRTSEITADISFGIPMANEFLMDSIPFERKSELRSHRLGASGADLRGSNQLEVCGKACSISVPLAAAHQTNHLR
jgi:hypothetical protein